MSRFKSYRRSLLNQLPFNGMERDPKPEEIAQALYLRRSDVVTNWETRSGVKGFLTKFLFDKSHHNFPSRISQHMASEVPKLLKEVQELTIQTLS